MKDKEWTHWTENCQRHGDIAGYGTTPSFISISDNEEPCWSIKLKPQGRGSLDSMNLDIFLVPHSFTLQNHESREVCVDCTSQAPLRQEAIYCPTNRLDGDRWSPGSNEVSCVSSLLVQNARTAHIVTYQDQRLRLRDPTVRRLIWTPVYP